MKRVIGMDVFHLFCIILIALSGEYPQGLIIVLAAFYLVMLVGTFMLLQKPTKAALVVYYIGAVGFVPLSAIGAAGAKSMREEYLATLSGKISEG